jgi:hypothetical protein
MQNGLLLSDAMYNGVAQSCMRWLSLAPNSSNRHQIRARLPIAAAMVGGMRSSTARITLVDVCAKIFRRQRSISALIPPTMDTIKGIAP